MLQSPHDFDIKRGTFIRASTASHSATGPWVDESVDEEAMLFNQIQSEWPR